MLELLNKSKDNGGANKSSNKSSNRETNLPGVSGCDSVERKFGKMSTSRKGVPLVPYSFPGTETVMAPGDGHATIPAAPYQLSSAELELELELEVAKLAVLIDWVLGVRPARLLARYSQTRPLFAHRAQVGFSLLHFNLDAAQLWQLSRSLGAAGAVDTRIVGESGLGESGMAIFINF
jgi:hypothetical protein